ncbi:hypothetical protein ACFL4W_03905 [Planctomycetota bacterium]
MSCFLNRLFITSALLIAALGAGCRGLGVVPIEKEVASMLTRSSRQELRRLASLAFDRQVEAIRLTELSDLGQGLLGVKIYYVPEEVRPDEYEFVSVLAVHDDLLFADEEVSRRYGAVKKAALINRLSHGAQGHVNKWHGFPAYREIKRRIKLKRHTVFHSVEGFSIAELTRLLAEIESGVYNIEYTGEIEPIDVKRVTVLKLDRLMPPLYFVKTREDGGKAFGYMFRYVNNHLHLIEPADTETE